MTPDHRETGEPITTHDYCALFAGRRPAPGAIRGVCGRVIRVGANEKPEYLSYSHTKRLAWVIDPTGLAAMIGKTGLQILLDLGTKPDRIAENVSAGMRWVLAVFPESRCTPATWDGLFDAIGLHYSPSIAARLRQHVDALRVGSPLLDAEVHRYGDPVVRERPDHPDHMTPERYLTAKDTPGNAWLFLWHSVGVNSQFAGTGYSRQADGAKGYREYLAPNVRLTEFGSDLVLIELDVAGDANASGWKPLTS